MINIYTDGSCINNGKKNAKCGYGIYIPSKHIKISEKINTIKQSNNIAELIAIIEAHKFIETNIVNIYTDSKYCILCLTTYGAKMNNINWTKKIPNLELVKKAYILYNGMENVNFIHIKSHTNNKDIHSIGNKIADNLAYNSIK